MAIDLHREDFPMHGNMSVCGHDTVNLNWTYTLHLAESLDQIEWLFEVRHDTVTLNWTYTFHLAESLDQIEWLFEVSQRVILFVNIRPCRSMRHLRCANFL